MSGKQRLTFYREEEVVEAKVSGCDEEEPQTHIL